MHSKDSQPLSVHVEELGTLLFQTMPYFQWWPNRWKAGVVSHHPTEKKGRLIVHNFGQNNHKYEKVPVISWFYDMKRDINFIL